MAPSRRGGAHLAIATTVVLWALGFPAIRAAVPGLGPAGLSVARLVVASLALALAVPFLGVRRPAARDLPLIVACGATGMTAYQLLLNAGEDTVPAGTASLLIATAPVYSVLLAVVMVGERPTARRIAGTAVAFAGCALIALSKGGVEFRGAALLVLGAAVVQGVYHTAQKPLLARYTGFEVTVYAMWSGTLLVLPWTGALVDALPRASAGSIGAAVFLGVAPSAIGFLTWAYGVARVEISEATAALYLVPAVAIATAYLWLGEVPGMLAIVGGVVALIGVVAAGSRSRRARSQRALSGSAIATGVGRPATTTSADSQASWRGKELSCPSTTQGPGTRSD